MCWFLKQKLGELKSVVLLELMRIVAPQHRELCLFNKHKA